MEKILVLKTTLHNIHKSKYRHFTVKETKEYLNSLDVNENNFIDISVEFNEDNETLDIECFTLELESDEAFNKRVAYVKEASDRIRKNRYEQYLKLKKEFEND